MSEARINRISNEKGDGGPSLSGITTFSGLNYFVPPKGTTAERPSDCPPGSIRFNTDSAHLEYFDGLQWLEFEAFNNELGVSGALGNRGVWGGGGPAPSTTTVDYITISTLGNAVAWGAAITQSRTTLVGFASRTRGCWAGGTIGVGPYYNNTIDYVTISSTGSVTDFGDLTVARTLGDSGLSNETRGIVGGGGTPSGASNVIDYVTIASTGNAVDYGDLTQARDDTGASMSSSTRGIFTGGYTNSPATWYNTIDYVTISTTGNAIDFGDLTDRTSRSSGCGNSTRGIMGGGRNPTTIPLNVMNYITIASTGNAQDFGDLYTSVAYASAVSSPTRGVWGGGYAPSATNILQYVSISTTGNTADFGDLTVARGALNSFSNGHGGL